MPIKDMSSQSKCPACCDGSNFLLFPDFAEIIERLNNSLHQDSQRQKKDGSQAAGISASLILQLPQAVCMMLTHHD
jgi:hypothetical protein